MNAHRTLSQDQFLAIEARSRAIVEVVSDSITSSLGFREGKPYSDSLWAASDALDELARRLGLDHNEGGAK